MKILTKPTFKYLFPPTSSPAPRATIGGFDKIILNIRAGRNFFHGAFVSPIP